MLFINSFLDALKKEDKKYKGGLKEFRGKIKKNRKKILEFFTTDAAIENIGLFFAEIKKEKYRQKVAERIFKEFSPGDNFQVVLSELRMEKLILRMTLKPAGIGSRRVSGTKRQILPLILKIILACAVILNGAWNCWGNLR